MRMGTRFGEMQLAQARAASTSARHNPLIHRSNSAFILATEQYFAEIDNERPYEPLTDEHGEPMSTAKWKRIPPTEIPLAGLIASQYEISSNRVWNAHQNPYSTSYGGDAYPLVVVYRGRWYLVDGHHRAVAAINHGEATIMARVLHKS